MIQLLIVPPPFEGGESGLCCQQMMQRKQLRRLAEVGGIWVYRTEYDSLSATHCLVIGVAVGEQKLWYGVSDDMCEEHQVHHDVFTGHIDCVHLYYIHDHVDDVLPLAQEDVRAVLDEIAPGLGRRVSGPAVNVTERRF